MVILDITAVNIALPSLAADMHMSGSTVSWTITCYSLIFGSLLLFGGRLADLIGRRRMFLTGLGVFTVSSVASALAGTATALFAARAGQGLGAAMLSPAALSIITTAFQGPMRAKALAAWGAVGGAGAAIGVLVGGVLTEVADWRLIFYVNIPVAIALAITATKVIPADTTKPRWRGLDVPGALLVTGSLATLVYAITQADGAGWGSTQTHRPDGRPRSSASSASPPGSATRRAASSRRAARRPRGRRRALPGDRRGRLDLRPLPPLLALPAERARHRPAEDGARVHPARTRRGRRRAPRRARRRAARRARCRSPSAFAIAAVGMGLLAHVGEDGTYLRNVLPGMLVAGFGLGIAIVSVSIAILTGTREEESGMISGLSSTGHEIGGTIGIAVFSTIAAGATGALGGAHAAAGISHAFVAAAALTTLASLVAFAVLPHARVFVPKLRLNPSAMPIH